MRNSCQRETHLHAAQRSGEHQLVEIAQMSDALEVLLKELYEKPKNINASSLRTVASALDFLGVLFEQRIPPDLQESAPPSILVDQSWRVVHLSESAGRYLQPQGGPLSTDVTELVRRLGAPTPVDPADAAQTPELLRELRALPPKQAAALVLRHVHGYTSREIAHALGVPERTIASRLMAARTRLQARLRPREPESGTRAARGVSTHE